MCGPRGDLWLISGGLRSGAGDEDVEEVCCFGAIAEVERRFMGRGATAAVVGRTGALVLVAGGDCGKSDLDVFLPLLCAEGGLDDDLEFDAGEESFCVKD